MSKLAAQRAMREAAYAARQSGSTPAGRGRPRTSPGTTPGSSRSTPVPVAPPLEDPAPAPSAAGEGEACGHRSMNGRTCTRPAGHAQKNHRYG